MAFYRYALEIYDYEKSLKYSRSLLPTPYEQVAANKLFTYRYYTSEAENTADNICYVVSIGYERRPPQDSKHRIRTYNRYSFHYFLKGKGIYNGEQISAKKMLIIPPCESLYFESDPKDPLEFYYISFSGQGSKTLFSNAGFKFAPALSDCPFISEIPNIFQPYLFEAHNDVDPSFYLMSLLLQLLAYHKKYNVIEQIIPQSSTFYYYSQAIHYIGAYLLSDITPADVAAFLNISYSYLRKIFFTHGECSVRDYILKQKFKYIADKLALTQCSIEEAANMLGYNDYVHFSKMFKKIIGTPPSVYRDTHKDNPLTTTKQLDKEQR